MTNYEKIQELSKIIPFDFGTKRYHLNGGYYDTPAYKKIDALNLLFREISILGELLDTLSEYDEKALSNLDNIRNEVIDSSIPVYIEDQTKWLHENDDSFYYCDRAIIELGVNTIQDILTGGIFLEVDEVFSKLEELIK